MKNNRFYENRKAIQKISKSRGVEAGVAARMLARENGWTNYHAELTAFDDLCIQYMKHSTKTLADLFEE